MARRGAPALYELLNRGRDGGGRDGRAAPQVPNLAPGRRPGPTSIGPSSAGANSIGPGSAGASPRAARTPALDPAIVRLVGFAAIGVAVLVGVYMLGVSRGRTTGTAEIVPNEPSSAPQSSAAASGSAGASSGAAGGGVQASPNAGGANQPAVQSGNTGRAPAGASDRVVEGGVGPALPAAQRGVDPRQAGLQYIVIASVLESNADKLVQFCRERGLDAWVVPDQNGRLREITVLPGIPKSELKGTVASELKSRIRKVGAQWKAAGRGNSDFEDHYFKPFNG